LVENYVTVDSKFPPEMWACEPSEDKWTNNGTESFHAHFNEQFYSAHPTIFIFIDVLQKVQAATYIKMRSMDNQAPIRRIEKDKICFLMEQYGKFQANEISRYDFIKILTVFICRLLLYIKDPARPSTIVGYRFSARTDL
jgi:hypothetical protein